MLMLPTHISHAIIRIEEADAGPSETHHRSEHVASPAALAFAEEVSDEDQRERELGERAAEYHHRVTEDRDAEGHEEHVAELVDRGADVAYEWEVAVLVVECDPGEWGEQRCKGESSIRLDTTRPFTGIDSG
jgi:hypothetical protein